MPVLVAFALFVPGFLYVVAFAIFVGELTRFLHFHESGSVMKTGSSAHLALLSGLIWFAVAVMIIGLMLLRQDNQVGIVASEVTVRREAWERA